MRSIFRTQRFAASYKRLERSGMFKFAVKEKLETMVLMLALGERLPTSYSDHSLIGEWQGYRECHIKGDLLLIYRLSENTLDLIDIGSHSYLFE